jgi:hypothetical protein
MLLRPPSATTPCVTFPPNEPMRKIARDREIGKLGLLIANRIRKTNARSQIRENKKVGEFTNLIGVQLIALDAKTKKITAA